MRQRFDIRKYSKIIIFSLVLAAQTMGKGFDVYNLYFTAGVYVGYSSGAAIGVGPKFTVGYLTHFDDDGYPDIANNITTGFIRHFGTVYPARELILEIQTVKLHFAENNGLIPAYSMGFGAGTSLMWYSIENDTADYLDFYCRPRASLFGGNILSLNASKTFGLPRKMGYNGLHLGGTAILGFPMGLLLFD